MIKAGVLLALTLWGATCTHIRSGTCNWFNPDPDEPLKVVFTYRQAVRHSMDYSPSSFYKNLEADKGNYVCATQSNCWYLTRWNGRLAFGDGGRTDYKMYHYYGSTAREESFTTTRTYADGSTITADKQNWWLLERGVEHTYTSATTRTWEYNTCCRLYAGVRNVVNGEYIKLRGTIRLDLISSGVRQNPHCGGLPVVAVRFQSGQSLSSTLNLHNLCSTPHDPSPTFTWSTQANSGLRTNGDVAWAGGESRPTLNSQTGIMTWTPDHDGLYAMQFTVTDMHGNQNVLDCIFDVNENTVGMTPYFTEVRSPYGGATPTSTVDIFNPSDVTVSIGQTIQLGIWAYAPQGMMTGISYVWEYTARSTGTHNCDGTSDRCRLQFSYTPQIGDTTRSICLTCTSSMGQYTGAPSDPDAQLTFCVRINVMERSYLYQSGYVRDFRPADSSATGMSYTAGSNPFNEPVFVKGELSASNKPQWDTSASVSSLTQAQFDTWFEDTQYSQRVTVSITLGFISGTPGAAGAVYEADLDPFYPVNCAGWETCSGDPVNNPLFTYELNTFFEYAAGTSIQFETADYIMVYIDGRLVLADTRIGTAVDTRTIDLSNLNVVNPTPGQPSTLTLTAGNSYAMSIFYVHRSATTAPAIRWQIPGGSTCNAVSGTNATFDLTSFSGASNNIKDSQNGNGMVAIVGSDLRLTTDQSLSASAVYYAEGGVAKKYHVRDGFQTEFTYRISDCVSETCLGSSTSAPGFSFIIQDDNAVARGGAGASLGYAGIQNALVIELDGHQDTSSSDPAYSHMGFHVSSGSGVSITSTEILSPTAGYTSDPINLARGQSHKIKIVYLPGQFSSASTTRLGWLYVYVNDELLPRLEYAVDSSLLDMFSNNAYVGFTAATTSTDAIPIFISDWKFIVVRPSATLTNFKVSGNIGTAGVENAATVIQAMDSCGSPVATGGDSDRFAATLVSGSTTITPTVTDNNDGTYTLVYTPTVAKTYTLSVTFNGQPINSGSSSFSVVIEPSDTVHPPNCLMSTATTNVVAGGSSTFEFQLRDVYNNIIKTNLVTGGFASVIVEVTPDPSGFQFAGSVSTSYSSSTNNYTTSITSLETRTSGFTIRVSSSATDLPNSPQTIQFIAGTLNYSSCSISSSTPPTTALVAGVNAFYLVEARDSYGNQILSEPTGFTVNFLAESTVSDPLCTTCSCPWSSSDNAYKCTYNRQLVGQYNITTNVYESGSLLGEVPDSRFLLTITPGVETANSIMTPTAGSGPIAVTSTAGTTRVLTIQMRDQYGNERSVENSGGGSLSIEFTGNTITSTGPTYQGSGRYTFSYSITTDATTTYATLPIVIKYGGSAIQSGSFSDTWTSASVVSLSNSTQVFITIGVDNDIALTLLDTYSNPVSSDSASSIAVAITKPSGLVDLATVSYSSNSHKATVTTTEKGTHTANFYVNNALSSTATAYVAPGAVSTGVVVTSDEGWGATRQGDVKSFRVNSQDSYGNMVGSADSGANFNLRIEGCGDRDITPTHNAGVYNFTFDQTCPYNTAVTLKVQLDGTQFDSTSFNVLQPSATNGKSVVRTGTVFNDLQAGIQKSFIIDTKEDFTSADRTTNNDNFVITIEVVSLNYTTDSYIPASPTVTHVTGDAFVTVTGLSLQYVGVYRMRIYDGLELEQSVSSNSLTNPYNGPGYQILVSQGPASRYVASSSTTYASVALNSDGAQISASDCSSGSVCGITTTAGTSAVVSVYIKDQYRAPITDGTLSVSAALTIGATTTTVNGVQNGDHWTITLSSDVAGTYSFSISAGAITVGPSSYFFTVNAGAPLAAHSLAYVPTTGTAGTSFAAMVCFKDTYNNTADLPDPTTVALTLSGALGGSQNINPTAGSITAGSGAEAHCFSVQVTETVADTFTLTGTYSGSGLGNSKTIVVANSPTISSSLSNVTGLNNITAGETLTFILNVRDEFGNAFQFNSFQKAVFRVRVISGVVVSLSEGSGATYMNNGRWSLTLTGAGASCQTCVVGIYRLEFLIAESNVFSDGQVHMIIASPEPPYKDRVEFLYTPSASAASSIVAGATSTGISIRTFDRFGNIAESDTAPAGRMRFAMFTESPPCNTGDINGTLPYAPNATVSTTYTGSGEYQATVSSSKTGTYYLGILYDNALVCGYTTVMQFSAAAFDPANTLVTGYADVDVNTEQTVTLNFRDAMGNSQTGTGLIQINGLGGFTVSSTTNSYTLPAGVWSTTVTAATFSTSFKYSTTTVGTYPFTIDVASTAVASGNYASGTPTIEATVGTINNFDYTPFQTTRANKYAYTTIWGLDAFGNNVTTSNYTVSLTFSSNIGDYTVHGEIYSRVGPLIFLRYLFHLPGTYTPTVSLWNEFPTTTQVVNSRPLTQLTVDPALCKAKLTTTPYRCANGDCVADYNTCPEAASFTCPTASHVKCWDGTCAEHTRACPCPSGMERGAPGACEPAGVSHYAPVCPDGQVLCSGVQVCRESASDCPSSRTCTLGFVACPDGVSCARSYSQCNNFTRGTCASANLRRCPDGSCAISVDDCATEVTCPASQILCPDNSCQSSRAECPEVNECLGSLTNTFRCSDGTCVTQASDCPTSTVCPKTYVKCQDGSCAANLAACGTYTQACDATEVKCPDGSCARNWISCSSKKTCPLSTPIQCPDGGCQTIQSLCPSVRSCANITCPDGTCVTQAQFCPTPVTCSGSHPVLCNDGSCQANALECKRTSPCGGDLKRCPEGSCRSTLDMCPTFSSCPDSYPVRCPDMSCKRTSDSCQSAANITCPAGKIRCPAGECADTVTTCPTPITCSPGYRRCLDGTCRLISKKCPEDSGSIQSCPSNQIQCPQSALGISCRSNLADCPQGIVCSRNTPVRCMDNSCKAMQADCPTIPVTEPWTSSLQPCPDSSFSTSAAFCTAVTCPDSSPFVCWDSTCRIDPADCPKPVDCPAASGFLCPDGTCRTNIWDCTSLVSCPDDKSVRCPVTDEAEICKASVSECKDPYAVSLYSQAEVSTCVLGQVRCSDGYCAKSGQCKPRECPAHLPVLCDTGTCVKNTRECEDSLTGCPANTPAVCWDGSCAKLASDCPSETSATAMTCARGYQGDAASMTCGNSTCTLGQDLSLISRRACSDGSCQGSSTSTSVSYDSCPGFGNNATTPDRGNPNGCQSGETRCNDGTCVSSASICNAATGGVWGCPANAPVRCEGGLCSKTLSSCPNRPTTKCPETGMIRCHSGDCVVDDVNCPLIKPCLNNQVRCADGTCKSNGAMCALNSKCPEGFTYRCPLLGECASSPENCLTSNAGSTNACPQAKPHRCDNGACVEYAANCTVRATISGTGCPAGQQKCWNNECRASEYDCPGTNGCASSTPFRCNNGTCVANPTTCGTGGCTGTTCPDGSCVSSFSECKTGYLCPIGSPIRCADGSCASSYATSNLLLTSGSTASTSQCPSVVVCTEGVACSTGSCAASQDLCPSATTCADTTTPYLCSDGSCAANAAGCGSSNQCPPGNPQLCKSGACVSKNSECPSFLPLCADSSLKQCFDGTCHSTWEPCTTKRNSLASASPQSVGLLQLSTLSAAPTFESAVKLQSTPTSGCGTGQYQCSDGTCVPEEAKFQQCPIIAKCPTTATYRCNDGTCVADPSTCGSASCASGLEYCTDGTCRASGECPRYDGCNVGTYLCPVDQSCSSDNKCRDDSASYSSTYQENAKLEQIGVCNTNCYRDTRTDFITASISPTLATNVIIEDPSLGESVSLNVPAGAFLANNTANQYLFISTASDSQLRKVPNFVRREYFGQYGESIPYSRTVLSTPFYCWTSDNIYKIALNVTVTAKIDRTYRHASSDMCLATVSPVGEWRCLHATYNEREANPITFEDGEATGTFGACGKIGVSDGQAYAFIFAPGRKKSESNDDVLSYISRYWPVVALICICVSIIFVFLVYYCYRKLRYRAKYKAEVKRKEDKTIELERMREVGAGGGNIGGGETAHMEHNPLQITIDNVNNLQSLLPSDEARARRYADEEKVKKKRQVYINTLKEENERLLDLVNNLKGELEGEIA